MTDRANRILTAVSLLFFSASSAFAGTTGVSMPWNTPAQNMIDNITGPTGKTLAIAAIAIGGIVWMFTRHEEGFRRIGQAILGIGLVLGAPSLIGLLGFQGAILR